MALTFAGTGSGQHVDLGTFDLSSGLTELSICAWVTFDSFTVGDQRIISKAIDQNEGDHYWMWSGLNSSQMRCRLKTGGTTTTMIEPSSALNIGQLYHLGFVWDGSNVTFYRDGQDSGSDSKSGILDTSPTTEVRIGDNPGLNRKEFDGTLEDIRVYERALSPEEMQTIYVLRGVDSIVEGLAHRWLLNDGVPGQAASGADLHVNLTGNEAGTPAANPIFAGSLLSFTKKQA